MMELLEGDGDKRCLLAPESLKVCAHRGVFWPACLHPSIRVVVMFRKRVLILTRVHQMH